MKVNEDASRIRLFDQVATLPNQQYMTSKQHLRNIMMLHCVVDVPEIRVVSSGVTIRPPLFLVINDIGRLGHCLRIHLFVPKDVQVLLAFICSTWCVQLTYGLFHYKNRLFFKILSR